MFLISEQNKCVRLYLPLYFDLRTWISVKLKVQCGGTRGILLLMYQQEGKQQRQLINMGN